MSQLTGSRPWRLVATGGLAFTLLVGALAAPTATFAKGGAAVQATGRCSIASTYKLKAKIDNGRIEVEFQVDQNRNNRAWNVRISDNGVRVYTGTAVTRAPSGSFTVRRVITNRGGTDTIGARATNTTTGEVCRATVRV